MKMFLILTSVLCTVVLARPDGYHVQDSENKFHTSSRQALSNIKSLSVHNSDSPKFGYKLGPVYSSLSYAPATAVSYAHTAPSAAGGLQHSYKQALPVAHPPQQFLIQPSAPAQSHYQAPSAPSNHEIIESVVSSAYYEPTYHNEAVIHKHVYVHVPPQEKEEIYQPIVHHQPVQKQKHYKIIFIKAPSVQPKAPIIHLPNVQNEEKTLVYVLYKKPEKAQNIVIPEPKPTKPSKPEVYFINYKAEKKALHEIDPRVNSNELIATAPAIDAQQELHHQHIQQHVEQEHHHHHHTSHHETVGKTDLPLFTPANDITVVPTAELQHQSLPEVSPTHQIVNEVVHIPSKQQHSPFSNNYNTIAHSSHDSHSKY